MTQFPNAEPTPESQESPRGFRRLGVALGVVLLVGAGASLPVIWLLLQQLLRPFVVAQLTETLERPLELGDVQGFSPVHLRFGETRIPATEGDADFATVERVTVRFNPVGMLAARQIVLDVSLEGAQVYLEQDETGKWLNLPDFPQRDPEQQALVRVERIRLQNATATVAARSPQGHLNPPFGVRVREGDIHLGEEYNKARGELAGDVLAGGRFALQAELENLREFRSPQLRGKGNVRLEAIALGALQQSFLAQLPLQIETGQVGGNFTVEIAGDPLNLDSLPQLNGLLTLDNLTLLLDDLKPNLTVAQGIIRLQGDRAQLEGLEATLGEIQAIIGGSLSPQTGFNLQGKIPTLTLPNLFQTFELTPPEFTLTGTLELEGQLTGPFNQGVITASARQTCPTRNKLSPAAFCGLTLDQVRVQSLEADVTLHLGEERGILQRLEIIPTLGGKITGSGTLEWGEPRTAFVQLSGVDLPSQRLARLYNLNLPLPLESLDIQAQALIPLDNWQNLRATVASNTLLGGGQVAVRDLQIQDQRWQGILQAQGVRLGDLFPLPDLAQGQIGTANAQLQVAGPLQDFTLNRLEVRGNANLTLGGGNAQLEDLQLSQGRWQTNLRASNINLRPLFNQESGVGRGGIGNRSGINAISQHLGPANANLRLTGSLESFTPDTITAQGQASLTLAGGTLQAQNLTFRNNQLRTTLRSQGVQIGRITPQLLPPNVALPPLGSLDGLLDISSQFKPLTAPPSTLSQALESLQATGNLGVGVAGGRVSASRLSLTGQTLTADIQATGVALGPLAPTTFPLNRTQLGVATATAQIRAPLDQLTDLNRLTAQGNAEVQQLAGGQVTARFQLAQGNWQSQVEAAALQPHRLTPQLPPEWVETASTSLEVTGNLKDLTLDAIRASGSARLGVAGGQVQANQIQLSGGNLTAQLLPQGVQLARIAPQLRGSLGGELTVGARVADFQVGNTQARGQIRLSQGVSLITDPLTAQFAWDGQQLNLQQVQAGQQLTAQGTVNLDGQALQRGDFSPPVIQGFNLTVGLNDLPLNRIPPEIATLDPDLLTLAGTASFNGQVSGTLNQPQIQGSLALNNLAVNDLPFDPSLAGSVRILAGQGGVVDLQGTRQDRVYAELGSGYLPTTFDLRLNAMAATGQTTGNLLTAQVEQFPLALAKSLIPLHLLPPTIATQPLSGDLSGEVNLNWATGELGSAIAITQPTLGPLSGQQFTGTLQWHNGILALKDGQFRNGITTYNLNGQVTPLTPNPQFQVTLAVDNGDLQDIITTLNLFDLVDLTNLAQTFQTPPDQFGRAADLNTVSVGDPTTTVYNQLRRLSEITALQNQQAAANQPPVPLPPLTEVQGQFNGTITASGALQGGLEGIQANFNLSGENWYWGFYNLDNLLAQGELNNGVVRVLPLEITLGGGEIAFSGAFGGETISGQLEITDLPIAELQEFLPLPPDIGFDGTLNASATLGGTRANPQARGRLDLLNASVNDTPISIATGSFNYSNARLQFSGRSILSADGTPLTLTGVIPYQLPLPETLPPQDNSLEITAKVQDDGLALLNILTRQQLVWQDGEGEVDLKIAGAIDPEIRQLTSLKAQGVAIVENGVISSQFLQDSITDLNGVIQFNFDNIAVESLSGNFGGGEILVRGILPTTTPLTDPEDPLSVTLGKLGINVKGLLTGEVQGDLVIGGSVLEPRISGDIDLANGRLDLLGAAATGGGGGNGNNGQGVINQVQLENLRLTLRDNFVIQQQPLLEFSAQGSLVANGNLLNPSPEGVIELQQGTINLFTSQLRLDRNYENTARFTPQSGLDPQLDIRLVGAILETDRRGYVADPYSSEVVDNPIDVGTVRTIRVAAQVQGSAQELARSLDTSSTTGSAPSRDILTLTSSPTRSQTEIVALLGGGFINAVAGGDSTALVGGLANLASNALLGDVFSEVQSAFGLSEFRIFPAEVIDEERGRTGTLGIAVELGKDIGRNFSVSVLQYLTPPEQPTRFNVRYRINDNFVLRGSTGLTGEGRASLEFESRF
ncbi:translocation/assembly module TamB domain-containing protein [Spirulina subsalsa FACHB-351]|uniref:Translocation/assembly module TamB domain-containing protein n=1 Tax=Spirulina subsalsa FACHB-351 TaxID=234711 RepID=A0ABT3LB10_9CYAN|nr:translocation/assembly module TamB domain-containing protein [Spirulina subsalsa]MCW6038699.1 translocation/assembly module TamB domain-containing protein [Spirulina subsalsa FACHB-351]